MKLPKIETPSHRQTPAAFRKLAKAALAPSRADVPAALPMDAIQHAPDLFQPRHDSVAYAPGKSEAHIAKLAKAPKAGRPLDPVTVAAMGDTWYLVDGHHRIQAYREAGWTELVPVKAEQSETSGAERVEWAIRLSLADNGKDRLPLGDADRQTRAWQAVARGAPGSQAGLAATYGISPRSIAYMREAKKTLDAAGENLDFVQTWPSARAAVRALADGHELSGVVNHDEKMKRVLAKRLKPVMDVGAPTRLLLEVLEEYEPHILSMMNAAQAGRADLDDVTDI